MPLGQLRLPRFRFHPGRKRTVERPLLPDLRGIAPYAAGQPRQIRRPERGGFPHLRAQYLAAEDVRLKLHQEIVCARAAVHPQRADRQIGIGVHRRHKIT